MNVGKLDREWTRIIANGEEEIGPLTNAKDHEESKNKANQKAQ
jgi:hypothetical protein